METSGLYGSGDGVANGESFGLEEVARPVRQRWTFIREAL
jgi:hypothetical protein